MDQQDDSFDVSTSDVTLSEHVLFAELSQVTECIRIVTDVSSNNTARNEVLAKLRQIFDKYLEFPSLLDRHVEQMVQRLAKAALSLLESITVATFPDSPLPHVLSAIYALSKVRGRKRIQKFLPHEVGDVEVVFNAIQALDKGTKQQQPSMVEANEEPPKWESIYTLWNWMGILSLVPFDCSVVADITLVSTLIKLSQSHLNHAGPTREMAAACLASWLSRPDLERSELPYFLESAKEVLEKFVTTGRDMFKTMGILQTLVAILKVSTVERTRLVKLMTPLWDSTLNISESNPSNVLLRKLLVKWWTRLSCAYLPPRVAAWRYRRGRRTLQHSQVQTDKTFEKLEEESKEDAKGPVHSYDDDLFHVPDQVEDAMGQVLESLTDSSTVVRWSAAKGVGRITERLPAICAEDVLDAILKLFQDIEKDHAWHGACLALAELARRGLLLPHRLVDVMPKIIQAVQYDIPRRQTSVGANVRDAACYTYWACARAYAPSILKPFLVELSQSIVVASLLDREVNCRRAASAAFQELVGRQGADNFKNGISILTIADYFSIGNRNDAYTKIAFKVAQFEEYRHAIITHLFRTKLSHWDQGIRVLVSRSLRELTSLDSEFVGSIVVPYLLEHSLDLRNIQLRHGSVLGLAEVVLAFGDLKQGCREHVELPGQTLSLIAELVPLIEKKRLYRGKGGEQMRAAVCRLIECISCAQIPLTVTQQVRLLDSIDSCIPHPSESIQEQASTALGALMTSYFPVGPKGPSDRLQKRVLDKYTKQVRTSTNPAATRGFALALGSLPAKLLAPSPKVLDTALACLCRSSRPDARVGNDHDAETRRNALIALARICKTVGVNRDNTGSIVCLSSKQVDHVWKAFFSALGDYNMERRGDVGSWSRVAAMDGLQTMAFMITNESSEGEEFFDRHVCVRMIGGLLKQLAEKLDSVRSHAGECLQRILRQGNPQIPYIPQRDFLLNALNQTEIDSRDKSLINWSDASITFPMVIQVSAVDEFFEYVMSGLVISVGCLTESVSSHASKVLLQWAKDAKGSDRLKKLGKFLLKLFEKHQKEGRVILPLLKTINLLMSRACLDELILEIDFTSSLLSHLQAEETNCNDIHRLFSLINVALGLLRDSETKQAVLGFVCTMLSHRFPRVRRYTAEHLYIHLLENPNICGENDDELAAQEILLNHAWDGELDDATVRKMGKEVALKIGIGTLST